MWGKGWGRDCFVHTGRTMAGTPSGTTFETLSRPGVAPHVSSRLALKIAVLEDYCALSLDLRVLGSRVRSFETM